MKQDARVARRGQPTDQGQVLVQRLLWLFAAAAWAFVAISLVSFDLADPPSHAVTPLNEAYANWGGMVGAHVAYELVTMLGLGAWVLLVAAGGLLAHVAWRGPVTHVAIRGVGILLIAVAIAGLHALVLPSMSRLPEGGGGLVGIWGEALLSARFGQLGAFLWITLIALVGATVAFDHLVLAVPAAMSRQAKRGVLALYAKASARASEMRAERLRRREDDLADDRRLKEVGKVMQTAAKHHKKRRTNAGVDSPEIRDPDRARVEVSARNAVEDERYDEDEYEEDEGVDAPSVYANDDERADDEAALVESGMDEGEVAELTDEEVREKIESLPVFFGSANKQKAEETDLETLRAARMSEEETDRNYVFPGLDLLEDPEEDFNDKLEAYVRDQAEALEHALRQYRIKGEVVGIESGPVITLYQVRLAPGTKVSTITAVDKDIARSLRAVNIRIVANTEGLDTVGIEVPNQTKEKVRLKELMSSSDAVAKMRLPMFLGKDASGRPLVSDLAKLPHMLIAGTTGSGKSVCMNTIIMGFLYTQKPTDLKMVLVDPKMVEMSQFKDIPHLLCPVVTEMSKAAAILEWAVQKMDERYELLAEAGCRDISAYNSLTWEELLEIFEPGSELEEAKIPRKLPYMVFVIDELADLMMTNKEVEGSIVRIAQKARAVGIHLILATQRPQANVVTGLIKSNMPGRVSFKVASGMDSRIVMDQKGGELLLGQGDMLMITPRSSQAMRAQGTLVDDAEIRRVVKFVKEHSTANFSRELVALKDSGFDDSDPYSADAHEEKMRQSAQEDPLFDRAVEIVLETRRGSVSLLQRRLAIGYTRASRLIEMMGFCGIIGKHKGSVAREVQMTVEQWEAIKARAAEETEDVEKTPLFDASKQEDALDETHDSASAIAEAKPSIIEGGEEHADDIEDVPFDVEEEEAGVAVHANRIADEESDTDEDEYEEEGEGDEEFVDELEEAEEVEDEEEHGDEEPTLIDEESQEADDSEEESDEEEEDWEYEYVDEDGNPIDAEELEEEGDEDWEYEESEEVDEAEERA